jgi:dihydroorotase
VSRLIIRHGRVIDPSQGIDRVTNLLIAGGRIAGYDVEPSPAEQIIDATGLIVAPGLIDLLTELREPGLEEDETIETGAAAALAGGYTTIACAPNTNPPLDTPAGVEFVRQKAMRAQQCQVVVIGCVSKDRAGKELAEIGSLVEAEAVGFSDGPSPIHNPELLRRALEYCLMFDKPVLDHPEVLELTSGGIMHEGAVSMLLGLTGLPVDAEEVAVSRDLRLAESTGGRLHLLDISTAGSVELIRRAKSRGLAVSSSVRISNLIYTDQRLRSFDSNYKVNPPLRSAEHLEACLTGLSDGTIDVIQSGHSPRAAEKKCRELDYASFGMSTLETTLAEVITHLILPGVLDWSAALAKLTCNPARVLSLNKGTLRVGADADVTIIDPHARWTVDSRRLRSKSRNSPACGGELRGKVAHVILAGQQRF